MSIRQWLRTHGYQDIDAKIAEAEALHRSSGSKERRNWADVLCGGRDGTPIAVAGIEFPGLASVQRSRRKPVTATAIQRNDHEIFPAPRVTGRWPKESRLPKKARVAREASRPLRAKAS